MIIRIPGDPPLKIGLFFHKVKGEKSYHFLQIHHAGGHSFS